MTPKAKTAKPKSAQESAAAFRKTYAKISDAVGQAVVGQKEVVEGVLTALLAGGHVLLEGVPGLGKTYLVRVIGDSLGLEPGRIQCTPA